MPLTPEQLLTPRVICTGTEGNDEEWKKIPGYEHYEISSLGRIKKTSYLAVSASKNGYPQVQLHKSTGCGKRDPNYKTQLKKKLLHRLIAEAFIPNPNGYNVINHKDGDKNNFSIENLEWCTHSENNKHAYELGLKSGIKNTYSKVVVQVDANFRIIRIWKGRFEANEYGYSESKISSSINHGVWYRKTKWYSPEIYYDRKISMFFTISGKLRKRKRNYFTWSVAEEMIYSGHSIVIETNLSKTHPQRFRIPVKAFGPDGKMVGVYSSTLDAAKTIKCNRKEIRKGVLSKKRVKGILFEKATEAEYLEYQNKKHEKAC